MTSAVDLMRALPVLTEISTDVMRAAVQFIELGLNEETCDALPPGALAKAAGCYLIFSSTEKPLEWPLAPTLWTPSDVRADFVKALALYVLEIARLDRTS